MFIFVVPFKSKACSHDWAMASELCARSIRSMLAASLPVRVILACHEPPKALPNDSRLIVQSIIRPIPKTRQEMMDDKYAKIKIGLTIARQFAPAWLMRADADDLISRRLVPFIAKQRPYEAWYSEIGWVHRHGSKWLVKQREFHMVCGTSCVTYVTPAELPEAVSDPSDRFYLLSQGHHMTVDYLKKRGIPTNPIPFPTTIYVSDSGENWSGPRLSIVNSRRLFAQRIINSRLLTSSIREEFGV